MRKRFVSDEELNQVIKLKQAGASWLMIQGKTGVPRRSAQKAYEDWQRSQSIDELKAARVDVAGEEFRKHVDLLIKIADSLADGLDIPQIPKVTMNAREFLNSLWERSYRELQNRQPYPIIENRERQRFIREYNMLLKSLYYHTREKVHWQLLEQWKEAWDNCIGHLDNFENEADTVAANIITKDAKLIEAINDKSQQETAAEKMAQAVLDVIWRNIVEDTLNPESPEINISNELVDRSVPIYAEKDLSEKIAEILRRVAEAFCTERKEDIIQPLLGDVCTMNEAINALEEMLNPLVLRPLILRTRCDLCPA